MINVSEKTKIVLVCLVAGVATLLLLLIRPVEEHGVPIASFWSKKVTAGAEYDLVAVGDSRVLYGLNPEPFEQLGLGSSLNFGFRGAPSTDQYHQAAIDKLSDNGKRIFLLGLTPLSFTEYARHSNGFDEITGRYSNQSITPEWFASLQQRFDPMTLGELARIVRGRVNPLQQTYHSNGWIESAHQKPNLDHALGLYSIQFDGNQALSSNVENCCEFLEKCVGQGIEVIGFRMPIPDSMKKLEDERSGLDYRHLAKRFSEIGAKWIEVDTARFATYDGSHLNHEGAHEFSAWLAGEVQSHLHKKSGQLPNGE